MPNVNYNTIERYFIPNLKEFDNKNSMSAVWVTSPDGERVYQIYSYKTLIASVREDTAYLTESKYSVTTSKQQNLIYRCFNRMGLEF